MRDGFILGAIDNFTFTGCDFFAVLLCGAAFKLSLVLDFIFLEACCFDSIDNVRSLLCECRSGFIVVL